MQEALHRGVPVLVIPFMADQKRAGYEAEMKGHGLVLEFDDLTKTTFTDAINRLTTDFKFKQNAAKASHLFRDNMVNPMHKAMFAIDYAIRHRGAKHLKSKSVDMTWCKFLMFDVAFLYFSIFLAGFLSLVFSIKLCIGRCRVREQRGKFKYT